MRVGASLSRDNRHHVTRATAVGGQDWSHHREHLPRTVQCEMAPKKRSYTRRAFVSTEQVHRKCWFPNQLLHWYCPRRYSQRGDRLGNASNHCALTPNAVRAFVSFPVHLSCPHITSSVLDRKRTLLRSLYRVEAEERRDVESQKSHNHLRQPSTLREGAGSGEELSKVYRRYAGHCCRPAGRARVRSQRLTFSREESALFCGSSCSICGCR